MRSTEPGALSGTIKVEKEMTCTLDPMTGSTKFQRKELFPEKGDRPISADELVSLSPDTIVRSASVSVNTSLVKRDDGELKRTSTISNPGNVGRLHPALPKIGSKTPSKRSRNLPSKSEVAEMRKKNRK